MFPLQEDPRLPTRHLPGTEGKLGVLCLRFSLGIPLFNPLDAGMREFLAARKGGTSRNVAGQQREGGTRCDAGKKKAKRMEADGADGDGAETNGNGRHPVLLEAEEE